MAASRLQSETAFATISTAIVSGIGVFFCRRAEIFEPKAPSSRCHKSHQTLISHSSHSVASQDAAHLPVTQSRHLIS